MTEQEAVAIAESKYGVRFKKVGSSEYRSLNGCPWCGDSGKGSKSDRFRLIINGNSDSPRVWCRQCDKYEFLDAAKPLTDVEKLELRVRAVERQQEEHEKRLRVLEAMQQSEDHIAYYNNMGDHLEAITYWNNEGMNPDTINKHYLGYCGSCPTAPYSASYTIPVLYQGRPYNIRHRLISPNGTGKYRPHMAGLPNMLFNADDLHRDENYILLLEGEKKSMVVSQETGLPNVGIMGMQSFNPAWVEKFDKFSMVYVALDPDADERAVEIAKMFGGKGMVVSLPLKADDFFVRGGGRKDDFIDYINWGRKVA